MANHETTTVSVRDLPTWALDRIKRYAEANGVKPGDGAACLYALTQFARKLSDENLRIPVKAHPRTRQRTAGAAG